MLRKFFILMFFMFAGFNAYADLNYIDVNKITKDTNLIADFKYAQLCQPFCATWTPQWNEQISKEKLIEQLKNIYENFSKLDKNAELFLFLGDIAHFLYNLDANDEERDFHDMSVANYNNAIALSPQDYRAYWFLGFHCSQVPGQWLIRGAKNFQIAETLSPDTKPAEFWANYANASALTAMPSHYLYAIDKAKSILKNVKQIYTKDKLIESLDKSSEYDNTDIWRVNKEDSTNYFISRPLGMRFWLTQKEGDAFGLQLSGYQKNSGAVVLTPPRLKNSKGVSIGYTILVIAHTVDGKTSLRDFVKSDSILVEAKNKTETNFSKKYDKIVSYGIIDKDMYPNIGGAHLHYIAVERNYPKYAGLALEIPTVPFGTSNAGYYRLTPQPDRFQGKIIYTILLDTCEDIHEDSLKVFKDFFENRLLIE